MKKLILCFLAFTFFSIINLNAQPACTTFFYCTSSATLTANEDIFNVTLGTLNNSSTCGTTGGPNSIINLYSDYAGLIAAPTLSAGSTYTLSVTVGQCGSTAFNGYVTAYMDYNQNGVFTDPGETIYTSPSTLFAVAGTTLTANITVPSGAVTGTTRLRVIAGESAAPLGSCGSFGYGETEDYCVDIVPSGPCTGAPASNTVVASSTVVCPGGSTNLSLLNGYSSGGYTYQWYVAPGSSGPYTPVTGATLSTMTATNITANSWYQCVVTCTTGPASTTATPVMISAAGTACQCYTYCVSKAQFTSDEDIFNVKLGTLNNTSNCTMTGGPGSTLSLYSNYAGIVSAPTLMAGNTYSLSITVGECNGVSYSGIVNVFIDYNQNGAFTDAGENVYTSAYTLFSVAGTTFTTNITIPGGATIGTARMRVIAAETNVPPSPCSTFNWGETEDYCVNIISGTPCSGAPAPNSVVASSTVVCPGGSSNLSLATTYTAGGLTYQWGSASAMAGPYTPITGATSPAHTATNITVSTWYQCVITCTAGPSSTTATPIQITTGGNPCQCYTYCASAAGSSNDEEIYYVSIGSLSNTSSCGTTGGPGSVMYRYSNYTGIVGAPNLTIGGTYNLSVTVGQCGSNSFQGVVTAFIDYNKNGVFTDPGEWIYSSPSTIFNPGGVNVTATVTIPSTVTAGTTRMRIIASRNTGATSCSFYNFGETEDYCVNIITGTPCSGAPASNTVVASSTVVCPGSGVNLSLVNTYSMGGITYQWSSAPASTGPYTPIGTGTLSTLSTTLTSSTWYQCVITCTAGPASTTATAIQITTAGSPCQCYTYCASAASSTSDEEIFLVSMGTLNNSSSCSTTGGAGSTLNRYSNYTGMVAPPTLTASSTYTLSVVVGQCSGASYSGFVTAFIDYNSNGVFTDPGEAIYTSSLTTFAIAGTTLSAPITIPPTVTPGITRMRIVAAENSPAQPACGFYQWGETEDYCVNLISATPCSSASGGTLTNTSYSICNGQSVMMSSTGASSGVGIVYQWKVSSTSGGPYSNVTGGAGATSTSYTTGTLTAGVYYFVLETTCTNASVSASSNEATVTVIAGPSVSVSPSSASVCQPGGAAVTLNASGAASYSWMPSAGLTATTGISVGAFPGSTTIYTVTGSSGPGCAGSTTVMVSVASSLSISAVASPTNACLGAAVTLSASGASTYTWSTGAMSQTLQVTPVTNSTYSVSGSNGSCTGSASVSVSVSSGPTISVVSTPSSVCTGSNESFTITATGASTYTWNTGANTSSLVVTPTITTNYTITGTGASGCNSSVIITESVVACPGVQEYFDSPDLTVYPNPNSGVLYINSSLKTEILFELFDVFGKTVLKLKSSETSTTVRLQELAQGVYIYKIYSGADLLKQGKLLKE